MKRKPGILSLVSAPSHDVRESNSTPLWWKAVVGNSGLPSASLKERNSQDEKRQFGHLGIGTSYNHYGYDDNDEDDEGSFITISERDGDKANGCPYENGSLSGTEYDDERPDRTPSPELHGHSHLFFGVGRTPETMASWSGQPSVKGATETTRMMLLTAASMGIAFTWGVEMTYCTPYLLSLGLTKGQASMIWLAGPLSGLIVQPVIGVVSDQSTAKWGRRRPFMAIGSIIVVAGLLTLSFTREIVSSLLGAGRNSDATPSVVDAVSPPTAHGNVVICVAVLALYVTDFAINAVMSCNRSLLVDTLPLEKQQDGAAWASRMAAFGHLVGYAAGAIDLVKMLGPAYGDTQFKKLSSVAALSILVTVGITCWAVTERVLLKSALGGPNGAADSVMAKLIKIFRQIWSTLLTLPPRIQAICWAVFWGWIGWFPFVVYSSTWVGETYFRYDAPEGAASTDVVGEMGRIGSYALTTYSAMTVLASAILPLFVRSPYTDSFTKRPPASMARFVELIDKSRPELLTVWTCGHLMFACSMFMAPFARSFRFATILVTLCGIPWTVVTWAPTALLGVEVNKLTGGPSAASKPLNRRPSNASPVSIPLGVLSTTSGDNTHGKRDSPSPRRLEHSGKSGEPAAVSTGELSGIYFGILNIYTTLPQLLGNLLSAFVFAVLEPGKSPELATDAHPSEHHGTDGPNAIAVTLFIGAIFAVVGAVSTRKLTRL
ncbi:solute carrier family 45, member 1/2/4 [Sporothrix schenckii 1099-18]|uniref:General alpha-glucoside permease n=2 Tax=Sporothrix schenckii TaxID=29908 RepID=U7PUK3_SPOS1|nr:solute carrier family 45, member 1/2/4 [Sporothrix schenckii 1099-18]ERS98621.1 hypothetical protein HMPREF1624_05408 [Sporothrix schenckii ATCC 58251]KJR89200.1 solute carrier family 45, member 1/2/4 [Sporothrix schenckii 1099-18]